MAPQTAMTPSLPRVADLILATDLWKAQAKQLRDLSDQFAIANQGLLDTFRAAKLTTDLFAALGKLQLSTAPFILKLPGIFEEMQEMATDEFRKFEAELGWLEWFPMPAVWNLYLLSKQGGIEKAWDKLVADFDQPEVLKDIRGELLGSRILKHRSSLVDNGLRHYEAGDPASAIYVLLPQVEGAIWDMGVRLKLVRPEPNSRVKLDTSEEPVIETKGRREGMPAEWGLGELVARLWEQKEFEKFFRERVYTHEFRHPVLHGRRLDLLTKKEGTGIILYLMAIDARATQLKL